MERITTLAEKIKDLNRKSNPSVIDVDLMMDYVKVMYADLLEWRNKIAFTDAVTIKEEPVSDERITAMNKIPETFEEIPEVISSAIDLTPMATNHVPARQTPNTQNISSAPPRYNDGDIRKLIGINDKYQFISELFGNDKEAYEEVINELNTFDTEEEALTWLHNTIFNQYSWNDEQEAVQSFHKVLSGFFAGK